MKEVNCQLEFASNPDSIKSYANIISVLMSSQKTTWKIAGTGVMSSMIVLLRRNHEALAFCDSYTLDIEHNR